MKYKYSKNMVFPLYSRKRICYLFTELRLLFWLTLILGLTSYAMAFEFENSNATTATNGMNNHVFESVVMENVGQEHVVKGRVTDSDGNPLSGVVIEPRGRHTISVTTDANGRYRITTPGDGTLVFSYVGHVTLDIKIDGRREVNVRMEADVTALDEVVVVGYGTQKKSHLTGAVSTINVEDNLQGRAIADIGRGLQGVSPGLSVRTPGGEIGSNPVIRVRGLIGSLNGGDSPLILLDNVEIPNMQMVNPDDVASITVLKDAAATSIYGAKAALGVILINTKTGAKQERVDVSYSNNFSFQDPWKKIEMAGSAGIRYSLDAYKRNGANPLVIPIFVSANQESYERTLEWEEKYGEKLGVDDPWTYGRDWYFDPVLNRRFGIRTYNAVDYLLNRWTPTMQHNLSASGTSGNTSFYIGVSAMDQSGMMKPAKEDSFDRRTATLRLSNKISERLTLRAGTMFSQTYRKTPFIATNEQAHGFWYYMYRWHSLWPHGNDEHGDPIRGVWYEAQQANTERRKTDYFNLNLGATVDITNNWKAEVDYTFSNNEYKSIRPGTVYTAKNIWVAPSARVDEIGNPVYVNREGEIVSSTDPDAVRAYDFPMQTYSAQTLNPNYYQQGASNNYRHTLNAYTRYSLNLDERHDFKFTGGINLNTYDATSLWGRIDDLIDIINPQFNFAVGERTTGGDASWEAQLGYFSRINYAYMDKYLFEANLRYDGTSKFPSSLRWRWFPSFSAGWVATEEPFMQWSRLVLDFFKVRGSWGTIGDQSVSSSLYLSTMGSGLSGWVANGTRQNFVGTPSPVYNDITWQDITTLNLGVDTRFWKNRLGLVFDWYQRDTENMIVPSPGVAPTYGATASLGNFGSLRTRGWELELTYNHKFQSGLGVNVAANLSDAVTTITKYGDTRSIDSWYVGKTYGELWGYETDRLYQLDDFELDIYGNPQLITLTESDSERYAGQRANWLKPGPNGEKPVYQAGLQTSNSFFFGPGDVKFKDLDGDGEITPGARLVDDHGDLRIIGNTTPRYMYGFRLGLDYMGVDFSVFLQGVGSRQITRTGQLVVPGFNPSEMPMPKVIAENYWTEENPNAFYPAAYHNGMQSTINNFHPQTRYLLDMSYLRVKNLTVGYSFPQSLLGRVGVSSTRIYTSFENFFTFDNLYGLPIDPEEITGVVGDGFAGHNWTGAKAPTFRSFSFGLQLNF